MKAGSLVTMEAVDKLGFIVCLGKHFRLLLLGKNMNWGK